MRLVMLALLASVALFPAVFADAHAQPTATRQPGDTVRVLFLGNSYLYFHNTPKLLEAIAASRGGPVIQTRLVAHGGWTLEDHWADTVSRSALAERSWDWVVMNEQSTFGDTYLVDGKDRIHSWSSFAAGAARFASEIQRIGARMALVAHWRRREAPARDDAALRFAFDSIGRSLGVVLVPAGAAWRDSSLSDRASSLYEEDGSHPSEAGSYLLASLLYSFLTKRDPRGAATSIEGPFIEKGDGVVHADSIVALVDLPRREAERLQQVAWKVYQQVTRLGGYLPATRPPPIALPSLPARRAPVSRRALVGSWRGSTTIYPVSPPASLELRIETSGDSLLGTLRRVLGPGPDGTEVVPVSIHVDSGVVTITDPKGPNRGSVRYRGVLQRDSLTGVAEFLIPAPMVYGIGRWTLERVR